MSRSSQETDRPPASATQARPFMTPGLVTADRRARLIHGGLLLITLGVLLAHAWLYRFLTDDAYISFRYARNLSHGYGLVFNPGREHVEGYSNFLWVLMLAGFDRIGLAPERAAIPLSFFFTVALWGSVAWFALRLREPAGPGWAALIAPVLLAFTRSFAVWSSSGLETRCFEFLIVLGVLRLALELKEGVGVGVTRPAWSSWLLGLACLTRPDGILISASVLATGAVMVWRRDRAALRGFLMGQWPLALLVMGHLAFRLSYYGDWLPNTYYAKIGGRTWWSAGGLYLLAFALEYFVWLWLPLVIVGCVALARRKEFPVAALFLAAVVPHAIYAASIGGDHFEYRPLDLYLPFLFLLVGEGVAFLAVRPRSRPAVLAYLALVLLGVVAIPWQSHIEFPRLYYPGFPGVNPGPDRSAYLDPSRSRVWRLPLLRSIARRHRDVLRPLSASFIGLRQEEHRLFLETATPRALWLKRLVTEGVVPRDLRVGLGNVGIVPYESDLCVLDLLGLTDRTVAHSRSTGVRIMAHDKSATADYIKRWGVEVLNPSLVRSDDPRVLHQFFRALSGDDPRYAAALSDSEWIECDLPLGPEVSARRIPRFRFHRIGDPAFAAEWAARLEPLVRRRFTAAPGDETARDYALALLLEGRYSDALPLYTALASRAPDHPRAWENVAMCYMGLGDVPKAFSMMKRALECAQAQGDGGETIRLQMRCDLLARSLPAGSR